MYLAKVLVLLFAIRFTITVFVFHYIASITFDVSSLKLLQVVELRNIYDVQECYTNVSLVGL